MNRDRLEFLLMQWSAGACSAEEAREFEAMLRAEPEARLLFRRHANLDAALREWSDERASANPWNSAQLPRVTGRDARAIPWPPIARIAAVAAVLLLAGSLVSHIIRERAGGAPVAEPAAEERTAQGCAVLAQTLDAAFPGDLPPRAAGETLPPGRFRLDHGFAQIEFFSGATLLVEGAAELEIVSAWEARCLSGKVRVRVPPAARGFRLIAPGMKLVDLGTEFAVNVDGARRSADVHVFEGEVVAHPAGQPEVSLRAGGGLRGGPATAGDAGLAMLDPKVFLRTGQLQDLVSQRQEERFAQWQTWSARMGQDARLVAYYPFRHDARWERLVTDASEPLDKTRNGGAVGVAWTRGRWPAKDALRFQRPGDRVRLSLAGAYHALTLSCWVKVDSLDHRYNALLLTDGYDPGQPHWQIYEDGRLMFSLVYPDPADPSNRAKRRNQIYYSPPVFTAANRDRWHHLAVAYDNQTGEAVQYFDGEAVSREVSPFHAPGRPIIFGPCELGNWGLPTEGHKFPIRNLDGCMDEFAIYSARLTDQEIREQYENGKPF
jgi:hypothetical protein